jgi:tetratricopeptide (TPR) repeat protein
LLRVIPDLSAGGARMKLFISYGHDDNRDFVRRIRDDLVRHGHECWIDSDRIHEQPDWRRSLMDALHDCDWTVGFLSRHAMRPGGITPQELAIAQDLRCGCLSTVLLEPLDGWQVPVAVGHAQWVDMSAWSQQTAEEFEAWYAGKLAELLARLRPELAERYAGEIRALEDWLKPVPQYADIIRHLDGFVGREWLVDILEGWRLERTAAPLFWLTGRPGTGKSAFSAWITSRHPGHVVALNMCRWDLRERCDAARVVRTLAHFIARRVQDYRSQLLRLMPGIDQATLDRLDASTLFDRLIIQPLAHCFDGSRNTDRLLLVVDGLDEAVGHQGPSAIEDLLDLLRRQAPLLPSWVGLMVTSRPEQPAATAFAGVPMVRIDAGEADNRADLRLYARGWLGGTGRTPAEIEALVEAIDRRADGNFIYLRKLREAHEQRGLPLDKDALPDGLSGLFDEWFKRQFPDPTSYRASVAPLLALIIAAETPVPESVLTEAMGWEDEVAAAEILEKLGSLFERRGDGWAPFHKSLRDWLTDSKTPARHRVSLTAGRKRLAALLWRDFAAASRDPHAELSPFLLRELPAQAALQSANTRAAWVKDQAAWDAFSDRCAATIKGLAEARAWSDVLAWCGLSDMLAKATPDVGWDLQRWVAVQRGDTMQLLGRSTAALHAYEAAQVIADQLAEADPDNAFWQRGLSVSHNGIGGILMAQGNLPAALDAYKAALAIRDRLARADPGDAGCQRDLLVSHIKVGDVLVAQGHLPAALDAYRAALAIADRLAKADPGDADWQRDLLVSHEKIGEILEEQGSLPAALDAYRAALAIADRLANADPDNAIWQRDVSISHQKIGDVLLAQDDLPAALEAYRTNLAIADRLANADPGNAGWQRGLAVSHAKIGDVLVAQDNLPAAYEAYQAALAIADRLAKADPGNAVWQRDLFVSLFKISHVLLGLGKCAEACGMARRVDAQANLLADRFPHDRRRNDYLRDAAELLARACGETA